MPDAPTSDLTLLEIVDRLVAAFHPEAIYLFGSRARGGARTDSDYDLLMVLPDDFGRRLHAREAYEATRGVAARVELFPCTRRGFERAKRQVGNLSHEAFVHGRLVYGH